MSVPGDDVQPDAHLFKDFDHLSPEFAARVPEAFAEMSARGAVLHSEKHGGYYAFTKYDDVHEMSRKPDKFSSANCPAGTGGIGIPPSSVRLGFLEMDAPDHLPLRRVAAGYYRSASVNPFEPRIREIVIERIETALAKGAFDVVDDLCNPITAISTLDFLGMPVEDWEIYLKPVHDQAFVSSESPDFPQLVEAIGVAQGRLNELIAARRASPREDFISALISTEINGAPMTDELVTETVWVMLGGGFDTTSSAMASIMMYLSDHPERRAELMRRPDLIPTAADEFVRYFAPSTFSARTVSEPTSVAGVDLEPGDRVLLGWAAANFDEEHFDSPTEIVFDRSPNRHMSYGRGVHRCLGGGFAQLELCIFLEELLARMPNFIVDSPHVVRLPSAGIIDGFIHMPALANAST